MAFLSLSSKACVRAKSTEEHASAGHSRQDSDPGSDSHVDVVDKDDEWYDTSDTSSVVSSPASYRNPQDYSLDADGASSVVSVKSPVELGEEKLLPHMPRLFSKDLPPCGLELQVAYELLVNRLRKHWLTNSGQLSALDVVRKVQAELHNQNYLWPSATLQRGKNKKRRPWCRESVFKYQLQWIDYFQREAENQDPELMTESELLERSKEADVPPEIKLQVERRDLLKMWEEWNRKKRTKPKHSPPSTSDTDLVTSISSTNEVSSNKGTEEKVDESNCASST